MKICALENNYAFFKKFIKQNKKGDHGGRPIDELGVAYRPIVMCKSLRRLQTSQNHPLL
jgi:hypothetical protein